MMRFVIAIRLCYFVSFSSFSHSHTGQDMPGQGAQRCSQTENRLSQWRQKHIFHTNLIYWAAAGGNFFFENSSHLKWPSGVGQKAHSIRSTIIFGLLEFRCIHLKSEQTLGFTSWSLYYPPPRRFSSFSTLLWSSSKMFKLLLDRERNLAWHDMTQVRVANLRKHFSRKKGKILQYILWVNFLRCFESKHLLILTKLKPTFAFLFTEFFSDKSTFNCNCGQMSFLYLFWYDFKLHQFTEFDM